MSSRALKVVVGILLGTFLVGGIFGAGLTVGAAFPEVDGIRLPLIGTSRDLLPSLGDDTPVAEDSSDPTPPKTRAELIEPFWEAWDIVQEQFVEPVDDEVLIQGAIEGMLGSLDDPHSSYMDPFEYEQASKALDGTYEGIGAWVDADAEFLTIISPMPDSPAERAGLRAGDQVIRIDGEDMEGLDPNLVIRKVLGPAGTTVVLTIRRGENLESFDVELVREEITIPSVESEMIDGNIAYIQLFSFGRNSTPDLRAELTDLLSMDPSGLIFDLRGNGGGFLDVAVEVASEFISEGTVLVERFGDGREEVYTARRGGRATEIPLIVLIDSGSASASEIVAGAIQDHERGLLVGEPSFGKGSVQNWVPLSGDNGAVRITIARWFTPDGRQIAQIGLEPDVLVEVSQEDLAAGLDPQLEAAADLMREMVN